MSDPELTPLQEMERAAMVGDRMAIIGLVDALRCYRKAVKALSGQRYRDGECDAVARANRRCGDAREALREAEKAAEDAEDSLNEWELLLEDMTRLARRENQLEKTNG